MNSSGNIGTRRPESGNMEQLFFILQIGQVNKGRECGLSLAIWRPLTSHYPTFSSMSLVVVVSRWGPFLPGNTLRVSLNLKLQLLLGHFQLFVTVDSKQRKKLLYRQGLWTIIIMGWQGEAGHRVMVGKATPTSVPWFPGTGILLLKSTEPCNGFWFNVYSSS